jgi:hypothetical protein
MSAREASPSEDDQESRSEQDLEQIHIPSLPLPTRIVLLGLSWLCLFLGVAGLLLPGLQGVLLLLLGMALMSVASDKVHRWLERVLQRHPGLLTRLQRFRQKIHTRFGHRQ